jgi:hypothetical protein
MAGALADDGDATARRARTVALVAVALAALPFVVSAVSLIFFVGSEYHPPSDHALIEMQVRDVGDHTPLHGLYSRADWSHPGPFYAYLTAPLYRASGESQLATNLVALAVNAASVIGMGLLARRRGGLPAMLCTLVATSLLLRTLGADFTQDPWNCFVTVLPYGLMIVLTWSLACGDRRALLPATVVASFLAQVHVGFVVLALPLLALGAVALVVDRWRHPPADDPRPAWRALAGPFALSLAVGTVLWIPTIVDTVTESPSNLERTIDWFSEAEGGTQTLGDGWAAVTGQFGPPVEWLTNMRGSDYFTGEPLDLRDPPPPVLLLVVAGAAVVLVRLRPRVGGRLVATLGVALTLGVLAVARTVGGAFYYRLRWLWIPPAIAFVVVAWAAWLAAARRWPGSARHLVTGGVVALAAVTAVNTATAATSGVPLEGDSEVVAAITPPVLDAVDHDPDAGPVLVSDVLGNGAWYARGLVLQLERAGIDARVPEDQAVLFGDHRVLGDDEEPQARLLVLFDEAIPRFIEQPGLRLLTQWSSVGDEEFDRWYELVDAYQQGDLGPDEFFDEIRATDLAGRHPATYMRVAVFVDERPPAPDRDEAAAP